MASKSSAASKSRSATKATGPNARLQGKALPHAATPANKGPVDTAHSNGNWDCGCKEGNVSTPIIRGSRKSY